MTNEELASKIQQGETGLYMQLWENIKKLIVQEAEKRYFICKGRGGVEIEDLVQCGFLALVSSVRYFDPAAGWKFTTYLTKNLQTEFASAIGYRTDRQKNDALHTAISLDEPLSDGEDGTYYDIIEDPSGEFEGKVIEKNWIDDLRKALRKALSAIPDDQSEVITLRYEKGFTVDQISQKKGVDSKSVRRLENKALQSLRRPQIRSALEQFVDDSTPFYNKYGLAAFNATGTSAVEHLTIKREALRQQYQRDNPTTAATPGNSKRAEELKIWKAKKLEELRKWH